MAGVLPLLEKHITKSRNLIMPRSLQTAFAACINKVCAPVEIPVATILFAIMAFLPMTVMATQPSTK
jgi:hypothetical protein